MPILFLIIGTRLGLDLSLACSLDHFFLRCASPDGTVCNLETTSGGHPARAEWFHRETPMSRRSLETGFYMRALPRREAIAMMAMIVVEHLSRERSWREVAAVCELIIEITPRSVALVSAGAAYGQMLKAEFEDRYPIPFLIPQHLLPRRLLLIERNNSLLAAAEHLGWQPAELNL